MMRNNGICSKNSAELEGALLCSSLCSMAQQKESPSPTVRQQHCHRDCPCVCAHFHRGACASLTCTQNASDTHMCIYQSVLCCDCHTLLLSLVSLVSLTRVQGFCLLFFLWQGSVAALVCSVWWELGDALLVILGWAQPKSVMWLAVMAVTKFCVSASWSSASVLISELWNLFQLYICKHLS